MSEQETQQSPVGKSLDDIAAMMAANREQMMARRTKQPNEVTDTKGEEVDAEEDVVEEEVLEGEEEEEAVEDHDDSGDDSGEDPGDEVEEAASDDQFDAAEIDDETLFEFEGLDKPVSLKELRDAFTADDTLSARLQETEAAHREVMETRNNAIRDSDQFRAGMTEVVKALDSVIAQPLVSKPDPALKNSNPAGYIQHLEAYEQDQQRIHESRQAIMGALEQHEKQQKEFTEQRKAYEISRLTEKLPELREEGKKQKVFQDIASSADYYGFSADELNSAAADHRLFWMARDAAKYRQLVASKQGGTTATDRLETLKDTAKKGTRVLRPKGTTASRRATAKTKAVKVVKKHAQTTGKVDDVAKFLSARRTAT